MPPTGDLACNPGMCPDWELNRWPFGLQISTESTEPHQPGQYRCFFKMMNFTNIKHNEGINHKRHACNYECWQVPRSAVSKLESTRANDVVTDQMPIGLRPRKSRCFHSSPKKEEKNDWYPSLKAVGQKEFPVSQSRVSFLFYFGLQLIGWGPPY